MNFISKQLISVTLLLVLLNVITNSYYKNNFINKDTAQITTLTTTETTLTKYSRNTNLTENVINNIAYKTTKTTTKKNKKKKIKLKSYSVPKEASSFKTYMDYKCITVKSSPQYKLQKKAYTSPKGLRKIDKYYCIALGSYYGSKIGVKYKITLSTGKIFWGILSDQKSDAHTDSKHQYTLQNKDIIEFIVETSKLPSKVRNSGDISSIKKFKGKVVKIERVI